MNSDHSPQPAEVTRLLGELRAGDPAAGQRLIPLIYAELHRIAASLMSGERADHTLQPTALVNEAYLRLARQEGAVANAGIENRVQFLSLAARAMRNVLIDHARTKGAEKRGGRNVQITLFDDMVCANDDVQSLIRVDETLDKLAALDAELGQIVELRFFGGLTDREIGTAVGISERSVQRGWRTARAYLGKEFARD